jgi:lysophospholipase L1-like esterase
MCFCYLDIIKVEFYPLNVKAYVNLESVSSLLEEDIDGICHNVPNVTYQKWKINSFGFRGKEIDFKKKEAGIRIVCFGGSETFGFYESQDKEWPSQLEEMLRDKFQTVEVINASVAGLRVTKRKDYAGKYVLPLKPDIMIIFHQRFLEYVKDSIRGIGGKGLARKKREKKVKNPEGEPIPVFTTSAFSKMIDVLMRCLPEGLLTHHHLWKLRRRIRQKEKRYLIHKEPMNEVPDNIVFAYERNLTAFVHYLKENHIVPVLSTFPALVTPFNKDTYEDLMLETRLVFCIELSENGILNAIRQLNHVIRRIAKEENLIFIDNDHLIPKTREYFGDNFHYTDKGAEFVARNVCDILDSANLIK